MNTSTNMAALENDWQQGLKRLNHVCTAIAHLQVAYDKLRVAKEHYQALYVDCGVGPIENLPSNFDDVIGPVAVALHSFEQALEICESECVALQMALVQGQQQPQ